ncbi:MAG: response regulator [Alteromonadaceae bacterium]|nr:response regulator [Alteromonadaceae bacterium]
MTNTDSLMHILLVDDHSVVRQGYSALVQMLYPDAVVQESASGEDALAIASSRAFSLAVLDINLGGMSGISLATKLLQSQPDIKILFFSMYDEPSLIQQAMQTGALGYISKRSEPKMMQAAITTVLNGKAYLTPEIASKLASAELSEQPNLGKLLTEREFDIFLAIAHGQNKQNVAQALGINEKTVANTLTQIKQKLAIKDLAELVHIALSQGYLQR